MNPNSTSHNKQSSRMNVGHQTVLLLCSLTQWYRSRGGLATLPGIMRALDHTLSEQANDATKLSTKFCDATNLADEATCERRDKKGQVQLNNDRCKLEVGQLVCHGSNRYEYSGLPCAL
eukprot:160449-Amphidinium_carterae.1